jgi:Zn-finger nucleic acid-binding protein
MTCPRCAAGLRARTTRGIRYRRCPKCGGSWFPGDKLRVLKDNAAHGDYRWIDIDLWKERGKFRAGKQEKLVCPKDRQTMTTVRYGDSNVRVDVCSKCRGVWLDTKEYAKIARYLERVVDTETVAGYVSELRDEFVDVFTNPRHAASELGSFFKVLHLLELRFGVEHRNVAEALRSAGRGVPGA